MSTPALPVRQAAPCTPPAASPSPRAAAPSSFLRASARWARPFRPPRSAPPGSTSPPPSWAACCCRCCVCRCPAPRRAAPPPPPFPAARHPPPPSAAGSARLGLAAGGGVRARVLRAPKSAPSAKIEDREDGSRAAKNQRTGWDAGTDDWTDDAFIKIGPSPRGPPCGWGVGRAYSVSYSGAPVGPPPASSALRWAARVFQVVNLLMHWRFGADGALHHDGHQESLGGMYEQQALTSAPHPARGSLCRHRARLRSAAHTGAAEG